MAGTSSHSGSRRLSLVATVCTSLLVCVLQPTGACGAEARPNVIFILADDVGYGDLASYGHPYARTPHLDDLAREGSSFRQFYATGASCVPSRVGFMTGRLASRTIETADRGKAVTERLHNAGYRTGHIGKWHLGLSPANGALGIERIERPPAARSSPQGRDSELFESAVRFLEGGREQPFYLNIWTTIAHAPIHPAPSLVALFADLTVDRTSFPANARASLDRCVASGGNLDAAMREYLADLYALDAHVGRLLQRIDELGLRDRTLVVFASDNGPPAAGIASPKDAEAGEAPGILNSVGSTGELRGQKLTLFEGGIRVPFIVRWPGHVPAGRVDASSVLSGADWTPSLCTLAGIRFDPDEYDGEDVSDIWLGRSRPRTRPLVWKAGHRLAVRDGRWKLLVSRHKEALYDLSLDAGESQDVAEAHPEVVSRLRAHLQSYASRAASENSRDGEDEEDDF